MHSKILFGCYKNRKLGTKQKNIADEKPGAQTNIQLAKQIFLEKYSKKFKAN